MNIIEDENMIAETIAAKGSNPLEGLAPPVHRHRRLLSVASFVMFLFVTSDSVAQAQGDAQKLYDEGIALRAAGKHEQALDRFRRSQAIEHRPQTYLALASELFELDKADEALAALDALYAEFDATMKPQTRAKADKARQVIEEGLGFGRIAITIQEKGTLFVDGKEAGTLPLASSLRLKEGPHSLKIVRERAEPLVRDIVVVKGETLTVEVPPLPAAPVEPLVAPKPVEPLPKVVQTPPSANPKPIEPVAKPVQKPVIPPQPRTRIHLGGHVAFLAGLGKTDPQATVPPSTCGVYCLPSMSVLAGIDAGVLIRGKILVGVGVEYLHATSTLNVGWPVENFAFAEGVADATMDLDHVFTLNGGLAHLAIGAHASLGKHVRIQGSIGPGVFIGQSTETVSGQIKPSSAAMQSTMTPVSVAEVTERSATIVLPVLRPRLGVSFGLGRVWLGIAVEGVLSLTKGPAMCTPQVTANQTPIAAAARTRVDEIGCADGTRSARPFERLFIASPGVTVGTTF
jgi:hypothetical protein